MTPAEANQARRGESIVRHRRIDSLPPDQYIAALHRVAAIEPAAVDRVLSELEAVLARLHPLRFYCDPAGDCALVACCDPCGWRTRLQDGHTIADLNRLAAQHSGMEQ